MKDLYPENTIYQTGDTIRFKSTLKDFDGNIVEPDLIKFIVYDQKFLKIYEITLSVLDRLDSGEYVAYYTPVSDGTYYYEWYTELSGLPSLDRDRFVCGKLRGIK